MTRDCVGFAGHFPHCLTFLSRSFRILKSDTRALKGSVRHYLKWWDGLFCGYYTKRKEKKRKKYPPYLDCVDHITNPVFPIVLQFIDLGFDESHSYSVEMIYLRVVRSTMKVYETGLAVCGTYKTGYETYPILCETLKDLPTSRKTTELKNIWLWWSEKTCPNSVSPKHLGLLYI